MQISTHKYVICHKTNNAENRYLRDWSLENCDHIEDAGRGKFDQILPEAIVKTISIYLKMLHKLENLRVMLKEFTMFLPSYHCFCH